MEGKLLKSALPPGMSGISVEDEENKQNLKISKCIKEMDEEVRDRFRALKVI